MPLAAEPVAYVDGSFVPLESARVSVLDRGYLFGDGVYEVTAVLDGDLVEPEPHLSRLERSLGEIGMAMPLPAERIAALHQELLLRAGLREGLVYLQVTRGAGPSRDFLPRPEAPPSLVMFTEFAPAGGHLGRPRRHRGGEPARPALGAARHQVGGPAGAGAGEARGGVARLPGRLAGAGRARHRGRVIDRIHRRGRHRRDAAQLADDPAGGDAPSRYLALAVEHALGIEERSFTVKEAQRAREAFQTSATTFVLPVVRIDGAAVGDGTPGPLSRRLRALYLDAVRGRQATGRQRAAE